MVTAMQREKFCRDQRQNMDPPPRLEWFTTEISPDGSQSVHIRPTQANTPGEILELNEAGSRLLMTILDEIARDPAIPWSEARQAVLRGFWKSPGAA